MLEINILLQKWSFLEGAYNLEYVSIYGGIWSRKVGRK